MDIDKIISMIRTLKEDGAIGDAPTNSVGTGGLTSSGQKLAGYDTILQFDGRSRMARRLPPPYKTDLIKKKKKKRKH